ncbi:MAG: 4Fe-4S binding protein [Chloroflexi bacterium]|nr:4Fe-4S binding protein [Chloroflexota bacterium]
MCRMCTWLGEGDIWYRNPKLYSNRLYKLREPGRRPQEAWTEDLGGDLGKAVQAKADGDLATFQRIVGEINARDAKVPSGQVLPLKDAIDVVTSIGTPLAAMMCLCRKVNRGEEETSVNEYSCMGLGTGMLKWERWPERYRGGVQFMTPKEATEWLEYWDSRGMMHLVMQETGTNFLSGICNCDYPDCQLIRRRIDYGLVYQLTKAEYVCEVDYEKCNGCGECLGRCHFNGLKYESTIDKPNIDQMACFGCGLCMTACHRNAIKLVPRTAYAGLRNVW